MGNEVVLLPFQTPLGGAYMILSMLVLFETVLIYATGGSTPEGGIYYPFSAVAFQHLSTGGIPTPCNTIKDLNVV